MAENIVYSIVEQFRNPETSNQISQAIMNDIDSNSIPFFNSFMNDLQIIQDVYIKSQGYSISYGIFKETLKKILPDSFPEILKTIISCIINENNIDFYESFTIFLVQFMHIVIFHC